jgi:general secretion pathway protein K
VTRGGEHGFAIAAAVAALALFALVAYTVLAETRGDTADLAGYFGRARLEGAADAGFAMALEGLTSDDSSRRWPLTGARVVVFDGAKITIAVEDERGKAPIAIFDEIQARRLFEVVGVRGERLDELTDSLLDWLDDDDDARPHGAEAPHYEASGIRPRNGAPVTLDELARVQGMTPDILARIRPVVTNYFGLSGGFVARTATPEAVAVATGGGADSVQAIERRREQEGQTTALDIVRDDDLAGRSVTVSVLVADAQGGRVQRRTVVTFTGKPAPAYYIREVN